jgi:hypothetical protein
MDKTYKISNIITNKWKVSLNQTKYLIINPENKESWHMSGGMREITCEVTEQRGRAVPDTWTDRWHEVCFKLTVNAIILLSESACDPHRQVKFWIPCTLNYSGQLEYCWLEQLNPDFLKETIFKVHTVRLRELK